MLNWYPNRRRKRGPNSRPITVGTCPVCDGMGERVAKGIPGYKDGQKRPCVACVDGLITSKKSI